MLGSQPRFAWLQISQQERPDGFDVSISVKLIFVWIESYFSASHYYQFSLKSRNYSNLRDCVFKAYNKVF